MNVLKYLFGLTVLASCLNTNAQIIQVNRGELVPHDSAVVFELWRYRLLRESVHLMQLEINRFDDVLKLSKSYDSLRESEVQNLRLQIEFLTFANHTQEELIDQLKIQVDEYHKQAIKPSGFGGFLKKNLNVILPTLAAGYVLGRTF